MNFIDKLRERGMEVRMAMLGRAPVEPGKGDATGGTGDVRSLVGHYAWGEIPTRPGLDRKTRSMLTIAFLTALGHHEELKLHIRATRDTGVSRDEVREIMLQAAIYAGVPAANSAVALAQCVYQEMDKETAPAPRAAQ